MWVPDLHLSPSVGFAGLLIALHGAVCLALGLVAKPLLIFMPVVILIMLYNVAKYALFRLAFSVVRVSLRHNGWYLQLGNRLERGPFELTSTSRIDRHFIGLSFRDQRWWYRHHLLITPSMVGVDSFRKLSVFLRWAPDKNRAMVEKLS